MAAWPLSANSSFISKSDTCNRSSARDQHRDQHGHGQSRQAQEQQRISSSAPGHYPALCGLQVATYSTDGVCMGGDGSRLHCRAAACRWGMVVGWGGACNPRARVRNPPCPASLPRPLQTPSTPVCGGGSDGQAQGPPAIAPWLNHKSWACRMHEAQVLLGYCRMLRQTTTASQCPVGRCWRR